MKAEYKSTLKTISEKMDATLSDFESHRENLESLRDLLQEDFDNHSEKWQESEAAESAQEEIDNIESILSAVESSQEEFQNAFAEIEQNF